VIGRHLLGQPRMGLRKTLDCLPYLIGPWRLRLVHQWCRSEPWLHRIQPEPWQLGHSGCQILPEPWLVALFSVELSSLLALVASSARTALRACASSEFWRSFDWHTAPRLRIERCAASGVIDSNNPVLTIDNCQRLSTLVIDSFDSSAKPVFLRLLKSMI
jgi:hypothetical protein